MDECFIHRSFRYIIALLTHTDNMFLSFKHIFLVSCIDSVPVTREVSHVGGTWGEHLETSVIPVMVLSVTCYVFMVRALFLFLSQACNNRRF